jgi:putative transposase
MDTQKVTAEYRLLHWMKVIQERQNSGQNIKEFCESTGISRHAYYYWQRKLRQAACAELSKLEKPVNYVPEGWIQIAQSQKIKSTLDIEVGGCRVTVDESTDPELLTQLSDQKNWL